MRVVTGDRAGRATAQDDTNGRQRVTDREKQLHALFAAMIERRNVEVLVDLKNAIGEVTKPKGWRTFIREIRRPAENVHAYGHLEVVVVVEDDADDPKRSPGLSIALRPDQVGIR